MARRQPRPTEVGETLTQLREGRGLTAPQAAAAAGIAQSTLTRYETGKFTPPLAVVKQLGELYRADGATRRRLLNLAREAEPQQRRVVMHRSGAARFQEQIGRIEADAEHVATFTATVVPGLVQTDEYARALVGAELADAHRDRWIASRRARRALLDEPGRRFTQITTAGALLWGLGGPSVMRPQLEHLIDVAREGRVRLGVVPPAAETNFVAMNGFNLYEQANGARRVIVGTVAATAVLDDARDVDLHAALLGRLEEVAVFGNDAVAVLDGLAQHYR